MNDTTANDRVARFQLRVAREFEIDPRMTLVQLGTVPNPTTRPSGDELAAAVTELPQVRNALMRTQPNTPGEPIPTLVRLLPEESNTSERFGIVTVDHAILRLSIDDRPGDRDNATDVTLGEPVWILDRDAAGTSLFVHASDGYLGWVEASAIWPATAERYAGWLRHTRVWSTTKPEIIDALRRRDDAAIDAWTRAPIPESPRAIDVIDEARTFLRTRYVWGGKTVEGIDCSGLTQVSFARHGILLPRDADQQANVGRLVATRYFTDALLPGDLLFFVSGRRGNVSHVALHIGAGRFIEAASGRDGVRITSLKPDDVYYDADRARAFAWGRRVVE